MFLKIPIRQGQMEGCHHDVEGGASGLNYLKVQIVQSARSYGHTNAIVMHWQGAASHRWAQVNHATAACQRSACEEDVRRQHTMGITQGGWRRVVRRTLVRHWHHRQPESSLTKTSQSLTRRCKAMHPPIATVVPKTGNRDALMLALPVPLQVP